MSKPTEADVDERLEVPHVASLRPRNPEMDALVRAIACRRDVFDVDYVLAAFEKALASHTAEKSS